MAAVVVRRALVLTLRLRYAIIYRQQTQADK